MLYSRRFLVLCWLSFTSIAQSSVLDDRHDTPTRLMRTRKAQLEATETQHFPLLRGIVAHVTAEAAARKSSKMVDESTCPWVKNAICNGVHQGALTDTKDNCIEACRSNENCACVSWDEPNDCALNGAATSGNDIHVADYYPTDALVLKDCPAAAEVDPAVPETTTQTCPQTVVVAGAEALQPVMMGSYTKSDITPGSTHSSRPIYEHADGVHMYFWAANGKWIMSGTGYNNDHGTLWAKDKDGTTNCPTMASGWKVWNGNAWEGEHTITVSTAG